eukprot:4135453-Karenia_brevis.AAC.1
MYRAALPGGGLKSVDKAHDIAEAWQRESKESFGSSITPQPSRHQAMETKSHNEDIADIHKWMEHASWSFCPKCGIRRFDGDLTDKWAVVGVRCVEKVCKGACYPEPEELETLMDEDAANKLLTKKNQKSPYYVTPNRKHWPIWDDHLQKRRVHMYLSHDEWIAFGADGTENQKDNLAAWLAALSDAAPTMVAVELESAVAELRAVMENVVRGEALECLLDLEQASKLAPLELHCDYKEMVKKNTVWRGAQNSVRNKKKLSVVRATWKRASD